MMRKWSVFILGVFLLTVKINVFAYSFDIYGVDDKTKVLIYSSCEQLMNEYLDVFSKTSKSLKAPKKTDLDKQKSLEEQITFRVQNVSNFSIVKISVVDYPADQKTFATLDLVRKEDEQRFPQSPKQIHQNEPVLSKELQDLFHVWEKYDEKNITLIKTQQLNFEKKTCPVLHCTWGFDEQEQKEVLPILKQGVVAYKNQLYDVIKHSTDAQLRAQAIFILAHDNNYKDLAKFLMNLTDDPSEFVRNNAMRVLGAVVSHYPVDGLNVRKIIDALNYPYVTDRNKAAYVLLGIVKNDPTTHQLVKDNAGQTLFEILKLQQPNNHDFAYHILKEISHKNYGERDYKNWEQWIYS